MITDKRLKELTAQCGMPESRSVMQALQQCDMEAEIREHRRSIDRINSLVDDFAQCDARNVEHEAKINELSDRVKTLYNELIESDDVAEVLEDENDQLAKEVAELRYANDVNQRALGTVFAANQTLTDDNERLREDVRKLMTANSLLIGDNKTAIKNVAEYQHEVSMVRADHQRIDEHNDILRKENRELRMSLNAARLIQQLVDAKVVYLKDMIDPNWRENDI